MIFKLIGLLLLYALGRMLWAKYFPPASRARKMRQTEAGKRGQLDDILIKCPVCDMHFPKAQGPVLNADGQTLYFCSTKCRDRYRGDAQKK